MSFGSFFTRALDVITPWNRGGEVQRTQQRKKKQEEQYRTSSFRGQAPDQSQQNNQNQQNKPQPQRPENLFQDLNQNLIIGTNKPGVVPVFKNANVQPAPQPQPGTVVQPTNRTPTDHINEGLNAGKSWEQISRENNIPFEQVRRYSQITRPDYGVAPQPSKRSILGTIKDTAVGSVANLPEVGLAAGRTATGIAQGALNLPHDITAIAATGTQKLQNKFNNPVTRQVNRGFQDVNTGVKTATHYGVNDIFDPINRGLDTAARTYERNVPVAAGGAQVYRKTQIPLNALAVLATLGAGAEGASTSLGEDASRLSRIKAVVSDFLNKPLRGNEDNIISNAGQKVISKARPVVEALNTPIKSTKRGVGKLNNKVLVNPGEAPVAQSAEMPEGWRMTAQGDIINPSGQEATIGELQVARQVPELTRQLDQAIKNNDYAALIQLRQNNPGNSGYINEYLKKVDSPITRRALNQQTSRVVPNIERGVVDSGEVGNILNETQLDELAAPTQIPVGQGIDITAPPSAPVRVPVVNRTPRGTPIRELSGDTPGAVRVPTTEEANAQRVASRFQTQPPGKPDQNIEGVFPRKPEEPFALNPKNVATDQAKIVDDYAEMLRGMGEGNGVNMIPDGEGGYKRVSNNFRTSENAGKRMTQADWREEAQKQLNAGKAEPSVQRAFDEANNPEVQSLLDKGEQTPTPQGQPITVKQAKGINVIDNTEVPQNLPETPGKVRVTKATAPSNAKSEAVAAETPPTPVKTSPTVASPDNLPRVNESDESFLKRVATDMQANIKRAVTSLKVTKKMTKAERANRAAAGEKAYQEAKAAGKSMAEQEAARKAAYSGVFERMDYKGTPIHSEDEQRLRDMVDAHYKDMPYQAGNVREAFSKLFHAGEPGFHSEAGNHIIPSDIKNIRKFLNESVPNPDGNGGLGDFAESALKELASQETGPSRVANAIGLQRAIRFTADISATGRQALPAALSHPIEFAKAAKKSFEVMFSHDKYQKLVSELSNSKEANYINDRLGAYLSVMNDDISKADDIYRNSAWAHKIPGVKQVVAASERQYNTILSMMRYYGGKRFIDAAGGIGQLERIASDTGDAEGFLKAIGTVTNVNTGRGFGNALDTGASKILSDVLVSPRGLAARIQRFNPKYYTDLWKTNPGAAKEAMRSMAIQTAVTVSALAAADKAGIYEDGQIKVGKTRYDITGGAANMVRTAVRVAQYMTGNRETTPFNSAEEEVTKWARNQLSPFLASALDTIGIHQDKTGTWVNRWGDDVTLGSTALDNFTPINASQIASDKQLGTSGAQTAINAGLNTLGFGVNTYQNAEDKKADKIGKNVYKQLKDTAKQLEKDGISTSNEDIGNYVSDGEYDKATRAIEYQLMEAKADPNASPTKIKKVENALQEVKLRQQGVPIEDDEIQSTIEQGDYSSALEGLNHKLSGLEGKSEAKRKPIETDIKRLEVTRRGRFDPSIIKLYQNISNSEWRKMGDPQDENYDPETYQKLWTYDQAMAKAGVSRSDFKPDKQKYSTKTSGSGGRSGARQLDTCFGSLKNASFGPRVQQYDTIDIKSGNIPIIRKIRPNIVHKITSSG